MQFGEGILRDCAKNGYITLPAEKSGQAEFQFEYGDRYAQVFAPPGKDYIAIEPMTAPANALISGHGLPLVEPGGSFRAIFRVNVQEMP